MANSQHSINKRKCQVEGCTNSYHAKGYCINHYTQFRKYGKVLNRTKYDPNEFRFDEDDCYISLYDQNGNFVVETVIDKEDYEKVKNYKWHFSTNYVKGVIDSKLIRLSRLLLNPNAELDAEHKDQNTLNNRKSNLREATRSQNMGNRGIQVNNTSGYKGVYFDKRRDKWYSELRFENVKKFLGFYNNKIDAAKAYDKEAIIVFGEFAHLNLA